MAGHLLRKGQNMYVQEDDGDDKGATQEEDVNQPGLSTEDDIIEQNELR